MLDFKKCVSKIGGWLTKGEGEFLYKTAKETLKGGNIVEIGSWKGRSTICFGLGSKDGNRAKIYAIDPHTGSSEHKKMFGKIDTYREFLENIKKAGVSDLVIPIKKTSGEAVKNFDKKVDFILVDGAHEYEFVKKDYELWFPKLRNGGLIAFHDSWHQIGVHLFSTQILLASDKVSSPKLLDTLTVVQKVEKNTISDRIGNILFVIYRFLFGWIGTIKIDLTGTVLR